MLLFSIRVPESLIRSNNSTLASVVRENEKQREKSVVSECVRVVLIRYFLFGPYFLLFLLYLISYFVISYRRF